MILANLMDSYGLLDREENPEENLNSYISQKEFRNLANEMGIMKASNLGAIDSKKTLLKMAGFFDVIACDGRIIKLDEADPEEVDWNFRDYYNQR